MRRNSKYNAMPTVASDGTKFPSKAEAKFYESLLALQRTGQIKEIVLHPRFPMPPKLEIGQQKICDYVSDFRVTWKGEGPYQRKDEIFEVKGYETEAWKLKKKMFAFWYPHLILTVVK